MKRIIIAIIYNKILNALWVLLISPYSDLETLPVGTWGLLKSSSQAGNSKIRLLIMNRLYRLVTLHFSN